MSTRSRRPKTPTKIGPKIEEEGRSKALATGLSIRAAYGSQTSEEATSSTAAAAAAAEPTSLRDSVSAASAVHSAEREAAGAANLHINGILIHGTVVGLGVGVVCPERPRATFGNRSTSSAVYLSLIHI